MRPRVLRIFAFIMICGAGLNVAPMVASQAVANCLVLLEAQQPFMVKAGCSRLQLLMRLDAAHKRAVAEGAAAKLVRLMERPDTDQGACCLAHGRVCPAWVHVVVEHPLTSRACHQRSVVSSVPAPPFPQKHALSVVVDYVLAALEDLARTEEGIQSLADAGGQAALQSYLAGVQRCPDTEESTLRSRRLLAALEQV